MTVDISRQLPDIKAGALRFWGHWFGRPYDNIHRLLSCEGSGDLLRLRFNEDEVLSVLSPRGLKADHFTFRISDAVQVRWEWFSYGRPKIPANLYFMEFVKESEGITAKSNADWYQPVFNMNADSAAVEMP